MLAQAVAAGKVAAWAGVPWQQCLRQVMSNGEDRLWRRQKEEQRIQRRCGEDRERERREQS